MGLEFCRTAVDVYKKFSNGGILWRVKSIRKGDDYKDILTIGRYYAEQGSNVYLTTPLHFKSEEYVKVFDELKGTPYERKCPDLIINEIFFEYEGHKPHFRKRKVASMISHGAKQTNHIIIKNTKGCTHRYIRRNVESRLRDKTFKLAIDEVLTYENGKVVKVYKKQ